MTPLKKGTLVQIDPTVPNKKLAYGIIHPDYYAKIGKVIENSYSRRLKAETYQVEYNDGKRYWFKDGELI